MCLTRDSTSSPKDPQHSYQARAIMADVECKNSVEGGRPRSSGRGCGGGVVRLLGASLCMAVVIASWVIQAEKLQKLSEQYRKPYFLTYWAHCYYCVFYIGWKIWRLFPGKFKCNAAGDGAFPSSSKLMLTAAFLAAVYFVEAYAWYMSLSRTNIPANTSILQSTSAMVFILSIPVLKERVTIVKVASVILQILGVILVAVFSYEDQRTGSSEKSTPLGYVLLLIATITYAMFEVFYKKFATRKGDPAEIANGFRTLGYMGIHSILWLWPPLILLHYTGIEPFEWPTWEIFGLLYLNTILGLTFDIALLLTIVLASPLFTSVGTVLTVPVAVLVDWAVQRFVLPVPAGLGIILIVAGFVGFIVSEFINARREEAEEQRGHLQISDSVKGDHNSEETTPLLDNQQATTWRTIALKYFI